MSIIIANGLLVTEAAYLYSDLITDNPIVPDKVCVFSYSSIDGNGAYVGLKGYIGSDIPFDELIPIFDNAGSAKILKSGTMVTDYVFVYTVTNGDIAALGNDIVVAQVIVNNEMFPASVIYSAYPLSSGDTITLTGLPTITFVSSLKFLLI